MSGICSRHPPGITDPDCRACNADIRELLPNYDRKSAEAEAAGLVVCQECAFEFYRTTATCPLCSRWTWHDGGYPVQWPFHLAGDPRRGDRDWIGYFERVPNPDQ